MNILRFTALPAVPKQPPPLALPTLLPLLALLILLLCLSACAPRTAPVPAWQGKAVQAQFTARVRPQAAQLPLQGGLHLDAQGGRMALITAHGRTLGHCLLSFATAEARWQCSAAPGMEAAKPLLPRVAQAVTQALYTELGAHPLYPALPQSTHTDTLGQVDIQLTEITRP